jgi:hypothetical protein
MAYRGEDAQSGHEINAPTADGPLKVHLGPNRIDLTAGGRTLHIADGVATIDELKKQKHERRASYRLDGILVFARGWPREGFGIWTELAAEKGEASRPIQRVFGVEPADLFAGDGLVALAKLDSVAHRVRTHLEPITKLHRGVEIGAGHPLDKVLFADLGDRHILYTRKLFRDRARLALTVHHDGRIVVPDAPELTITNRFSITVRGDFLRFADKTGVDIARVAVPWVGPEERDELSRRIGQLVHRD